MTQTICALRRNATFINAILIGVLLAWLADWLITGDYPFCPISYGR